MKQYLLNLDQSLFDKARIAAKARGISIAAFIREAIDEKLRRPNMGALSGSTGKKGPEPDRPV